VTLSNTSAFKSRQLKMGILNKKIMAYIDIESQKQHIQP